MAPILIFGYGNPSRGDDALGPALIARLEALQATRGAGQPPPWDLLTDFQPQPEHALDLVGRERVILVDADVSLAVPYRLEPIVPDRDASYTTHAMSPGALLWVHTQIGYGPPPPCFLLRIRGHHFALGAPLSAGAVANLARAEGVLRGFLGVG
ncbi:MAG: hydrogenase maturation protease [Chromatiaceae bacterium]|nr:hydrogenase maturation protease [Chromatiaceae bacterium]